jgi:hypothetical protein
MIAVVHSSVVEIHVQLAHRSTRMMIVQHVQRLIMLVLLSALRISHVLAWLHAQKVQRLHQLQQLKPAHTVRCAILSQ